MTHKWHVLPCSIRSIGQARLGFDPTSSHFHVIEFVEVEGACVGWRSTHLKLQHGSLRNLNGARVVLFYVQNREVFFLMVLCTWLSTLR